MSQILKKIQEIDPNNSDAVKDALVTFFQNLSKHAEVDSNRWLRALENVINRFPKYCSSHRNIIENYLVHFIDSTNYFNAIEAAKCAHSLQQVRPSQDKAATAKVCWREHMVIVCNAAHKLLGLLFPHSVDIYKGNDNGQKTQLQSSTVSPLYTALLQDGPIDKTQNNKQLVLNTRLSNVFVLLQAMLVEIYPVAKPVQPQMILEVIVRALSISSGNKTNLDTCTIAAIKTQALKTLDALVACLGPNLIPFSSLIIKFVMQTLRWSVEHPNEESSKVRCRAYNSLSGWLRALRTHYTRGASGSSGAWPDELVARICDDVTPRRHIVQLTMNSQPTKYLSKKAKRKLANTMLQESSIASHMPGEKNKMPVTEESDDEVAIAALECAETFIVVCGVFLKPAIHKLLQEQVIRECYNLEQYPNARAVCLLRALDALRKAAPPDTPPPTHHCLQLYSRLLHAPKEISRICSEALLDIRLHLHCSPPSLNFALEPQRQQKEPEKKKKISERNRAALESLLGDRIPEKDLTEDEVIDIPDDEPVSKKLRFTIEDDQICVSSDSDEPFVNQNVCEVAVTAEIDFETNNIGDIDTANITEVDLNILQDPNSRVIEELTEIEEIIDEEPEEVVKSLEQPAKQTVPTADEANNKEDSSPAVNIYEAKTQMLLNTSNAIEPCPVSSGMEVAYDFSNTGKDKVIALEKIDDENLPCTNDTDDVQITCGQVVKSSQDVEIDKSKEIRGKENVEEKVNGDATTESNGDMSAIEIVPEKISATKDVNVEDMLADFVDEVNEEPKTGA